MLSAKDRQKSKDQNLGNTQLSLELNRDSFPESNQNFLDDFNYLSGLDQPSLDLDNQEIPISEYLKDFIESDEHNIFNEVSMTKENNLNNNYFDNYESISTKDSFDNSRGTTSNSKFSSLKVTIQLMTLPIFLEPLFTILAVSQQNFQQLFKSYLEKDQTFIYPRNIQEEIRNNLLLNQPCKTFEEKEQRDEKIREFYFFGIVQVIVLREARAERDSSVICDIAFFHFKQFQACNSSQISCSSVLNFFEIEKLKNIIIYLINENDKVLKVNNIRYLNFFRANFYFLDMCYVFFSIADEKNIDLENFKKVFVYIHKRITTYLSNQIVQTDFTESEWQQLCQLSQPKAGMLSDGNRVFPPNNIPQVSFFAKCNNTVPSLSMVNDLLNFPFERTSVDHHLEIMLSPLFKILNVSKIKFEELIAEYVKEPKKSFGSLQERRYEQLKNTLLKNISGQFIFDLHQKNKIAEEFYFYSILQVVRFKHKALKKLQGVISEKAFFSFKIFKKNELKQLQLVNVLQDIQIEEVKKVITYLINGNSKIISSKDKKSKEPCKANKYFLNMCDVFFLFLERRDVNLESFKIALVYIHQIIEKFSGNKDISIGSLEEKWQRLCQLSQFKLQQIIDTTLLSNSSHFSNTPNFKSPFFSHINNNYAPLAGGLNLPQKRTNTDPHVEQVHKQYKTNNTLN